MPTSNPWLPCLAACFMTTACDGPNARARYFPRAEWRPPLACTSIEAPADGGAVADLSNISDSTFAVLLGDDRRLLILDADFRQVDSIAFDNDGPRGVRRPVSALVTDTMVFIADDARSSIRYFTRTGSDAGTVRLPFIPRRLRLVGSQLVVTPLVAGGTPAHLTFVLRGRTPVPLGGTIARYEDVGLNTLANMTSVAALDDRVVVMHEMVVPFGYVLRPAHTENSARRFSVPIPEDVRKRAGRVPNEPLTARNVRELAVVAFAAAPVPKSRAIYYVTRSAAEPQKQKLLVRIDSLLNVEAAFPISVSPQHMIYLPARGALVVVDGNSDWSECKI